MKGLSPRVRGTGRRPSSARRLFPVHPRACGERQVCEVQRHATNGSSPRVRGTVGRAPPCRGHDRFIPARAGNGAFTFAKVTSSSVHPRACGERWAPGLRRTSMTGSSPRVRGTAFTFGADDGSSPRVRGAGAADQHDRFIPARAGNGGATRSRGAGCTVHPRACGERTRRYVIYNM